MKINEVVTFLKKYNFEETKFINTHTIRGINQSAQTEDYNYLPFENIYINKEKSELYIIVEKECLFTLDEIEEFENLVLTFINFRSNDDPLRNNINLLLLCPLKMNEKERLKNGEIIKLLNVERSKYNCRKILLDTASDNFDNELAILPSFPIKIKQERIQVQELDLLVNIKSIISTNLFAELSKETNQINVESVLSLLRKKDDDIE